MSTGAWFVIGAVVLALAFGAYRARTDGHVRRTPPSAPSAERPASVLAGTPWEQDLGERATLLQFSSAFCAPCRTTRAVLSDVAATTDGVRHVEVDAEQHLDVVRRLGILRTPTTLVLDRHGVEIGRAAGAARRDQVVAALAAVPESA